MKDWSVLIKSLSDENQLYFWGLFMQYDHEIEIKCENEFVLPIWNFIKSQLDKMKEKYFEKTVLTNRNNGKLGGRPKKDESETNPNNPMGLNETQITPKDKDNNNDKENDNDLPPSAKEKSFKNLSETEFYQTIKEFSEKYPSKMLREFFDYWREPMANKKMRMTGEKAWDLSRRLSTWNNRNSNKNSNGNNTINPTNTDGTRNLALARRR